MLYCVNILQCTLCKHLQKLTIASDNYHGLSAKQLDQLLSALSLGQIHIDSFAQYTFYHLPPQLSTFAWMIAFLWVVYLVLKLRRFCAFFTGTVVGVPSMHCWGRVHKWHSFYLKWSVEMPDLVLVYVCRITVWLFYMQHLIVTCNCVVSKCPSACIMPCDTSTLWYYYLS